MALLSFQQREKVLQALPVLNLLLPQLIVLCLQLQQPIPLLKYVCLRAAERLFWHTLPSISARDYKESCKQGYRRTLINNMRPTKVPHMLLVCARQKGRAIPV